MQNGVQPPESEDDLEFVNMHGGKFTTQKIEFLIPEIVHVECIHTL